MDAERMTKLKEALSFAKAKNGSFDALNTDSLEFKKILDSISTMSTPDLEKTQGAFQILKIDEQNEGSIKLASQLRYQYKLEELNSLLDIIKLAILKKK